MLKAKPVVRKDLVVGFREMEVESQLFNVKQWTEQSRGRLVGRMKDIVDRVKCVLLDGGKCELRSESCRVILAFRIGRGSLRTQ